eukprot:COSAG05_NODE_1897_length_3873_cov_28.019873_5_plen_93_part_00
MGKPGSGAKSEAEAALQRAVGCRPPSYTAWRYLLSLAIEDGRAEDALLASDELCCYLHARDWNGADDVPNLDMTVFCHTYPNYFGDVFVPRS